MAHLDIFEWLTWNHFLASIAAPGARRIETKPGAPLPLAAAGSPTAMLHVNLSDPSRAFPNYAKWIESYRDIDRPVINGYCRSIDKWSVQDACLRAGLAGVKAVRDGDPDEEVIVKSRANYGGLAEVKLDVALVGDLRPPPWPYPQRVQLFRRADVPAAMWDDQGLTVERYVDNRMGLFRRAYVVGEYAAAATSHSSEVLKTMEQGDGVTTISVTSAAKLADDPRDPLSVALRIARAMRVDFAAIDLAVDDDGMNYPIDVNTTPSWGTGQNPRLIREVIEAMTNLVARGSLYAEAN